MRLLVISDTHGNYPLAVKVLEDAGPVDLIIHLGDVIEDARMVEAITGRPLVKIPGNCDLEVEDARAVSLSCEGTKLFITHGDRYLVKTGLAQLRKKAAAEQARIVLYGHTHSAAIVEIDGILFVNPGALSVKCPTPSYATITISGGDVAAEIKPVNGDQ
jgi:putative phosphoesterase